MKTLKRLVACFLTIAMIVACMPGVYAAGTCTVSVGSGVLEKDGKLILPVSIQNVPDTSIASAELKIAYDSSNLKLTLITADYYDIDENSDDTGLFNAGSMAANPATGAVSWANARGLKVGASGVLFWAVFEMVESAINGEYVVELQVGNAHQMFTDKEDNPIAQDSIVVNHGTVTLTGGVNTDDFKPAFTQNPQSASYVFANAASALTVAASVKAPENAELTYQWYSNTVNSNEGGTAVPDATGTSYTPALTEFGTTYYYCVATNSYQGKTYTTASQAAAISYAPAPMGQVTLNQSSFVYTGAEITPMVTVEGLTDKDYTLSGDTSATAVGNYTITATGKGNYTGTASANWSITPASLTVSGNKSMTIYNNGKTYAIGADVFSAAAVDGAQVETSYALTSGEEFVTLDNGSLTAKAPGTAVVTATAKAANHQTATAQITVTVKEKENASGSMTFTAKKDTATYTGSPMALSEFVNAAACSLDGGTIRYRLNNAAADLSTTVTNAGTYTVTAIYESDTHYGEKSLTFTIEKAVITVNAQWNYTAPFTYDGTEKAVALVDVPDTVKVTYGGTCKATNAGTYTASAALEPVDSDNYQVSGTVTDLKWSIEKAVIPVEASWDYKAPFTYDGNEKTVALTGVPENVDITYGGTCAATDASTYEATAALSAKDANHVVNATVAPLTWVIEKAAVTVPVAPEDLIFNGTEQTGVAATDKYTVTGGEATDAGTYTATVTLKDTKNYQWATSFNGSLEWSIAQADARNLTDAVALLYTDTAARTITQDDLLAKCSNAGTVTITNVEKSDSENLLTAVALTDGVVTYALADGLTAAHAGKTAVITVTFDSKNYKTSTLTVTVTVNNKQDVSDQMVFPDGDGVYTGVAHTHEAATFNGSSENITYTYSATPVNVGTYTVTATYDDATRHGTKTATYEITPKMLIASGGTVETRAYDGTTAATVTNVEFAGLVNGETLTKDDYQIANAAFDNANAGVNKAVSYTVTLNNTSVTGNYRLSNTTATSSGSITPKQITVSVAPIDNQVFTGSELKPTAVVSAEGLVDGESLTAGTDYTVSYSNNTNAGTAGVTVSSKSGSNYSFETVEASFKINKAAALQPADIQLSYVYAESGSKSVALPALPENAGNAQIAVTNVNGKAVADPQIKDGQLVFTLQAEDSTAVGTQTVVTLTITMDNYENSTLRVVITRTDKTLVSVAADDITVTYTGEALTVDDIRGSAAAGSGEAVEGTWEWVTDPAAMVNANEAGYSAEIKFVPRDSVHYAEAVTTITVIVLKATPTGEPEYKEITEEGKQLSDAALAVGSIQPAGGEIAWELPETTKVQAGEAYKWIYTPADTDNFNVLTGEIVLCREAYVPPIQISGSKPANKPAVSFKDVDPNAWYAEAVEMVVEEGLFNGVSDDRFDPEGRMTRAMLVTVLWRLDGKAAAKADCSFKDVLPGQWYSEAVAWASENEIVKGYDADTFGTNDFITREQMATILYRYANYASIKTGARADLSGFADAASVHSYAETSVAWAVAEGLINGLGVNLLAPDGFATRAQVATILMRFVENVMK